MIESLIVLLIFALVLVIIFWLLKQLLPAPIINVVGIILGLILLLACLHRFGVFL